LSQEFSKVIISESAVHEYSCTNGPLLPLKAGSAPQPTLSVVSYQLFHPGCSLSWLNSLNQHKNVSKKKKIQHILSEWTIWIRVSEPVQRHGWNSLVQGDGTLNGKRGNAKRWDSHSWHVQAV